MTREEVELLLKFATTRAISVRHVTITPAELADLCRHALGQQELEPEGGDHE